MAAYVTLEQAKTHLREVDPANNADVYMKVQQASDIVADYLKSRVDLTWDDVTAPTPVKAATLLMLTHLYEHRGDDMAVDALLWQAFERLLVRFRDPALA